MSTDKTRDCAYGPPSFFSLTWHWELARALLALVAASPAVVMLLLLALVDSLAWRGKA